MPAYNASSGATTGKPSAEYDTYLKSLNKPSSANYVPTPDDPGMANMDATPNPAVNTAQPSPTKVGINPPNAPLNPALTSNPNDAPGAFGPNPVGEKFKQGLAKTNASGVVSPPTMGGAANTISNTVPKDQGLQSSPLTPIVEEDKNFDNIFSQFDDYFSPPKQKQSLLQEYKSMEKNLGINSMNEELLNSKRIIEGTEDDIRSEVQAASGFATDSQVLALANARNKSLVKNYNYLLESRDSAMTQLNTMMNLSVQDRQSAEKEFDTKMNFAFKVKEFQDRATSNAKEAYNNVIKNVGYAGLYQSLQQDPSSIPLVEKTLGMASGSLAKLATYTPPQSEEDKLKLQGMKLNNQGQALQNQKLQQDLTGTVGGVDEKTMGKIQASPEYKTINGVLPALQALKSYKDAVDNYGTAEVFSGAGKGELAGTYGNAIAAWKTLAGLGALSGADFALAENAVPSTGFFQRSSTMKGKLDASIDNAITQATNLTTRLQQNYPKAKENLQTQLDYAKAIAYPDKFKVGNDGLVYEITDGN